MLIKDVLTLAAEELGRPDLAEAVGTAYTAAAPLRNSSWISWVSSLSAPNTLWASS